VFRFTLKSLAVGLVAASAILPGCVAKSRYALTADELARMQDENQYTRGQLSEAEEALVAAGAEKEMLAQRAALAEQLKAENAKLQALVDDMKKKGAIFTPDGTSIITQDGMYGYRAQGDVVFNVGSDSLTSKGRKVLEDVSAELKKHSDPIVIIGHTDSDPVKKTADKYPHGNIELGAKRAISVKEFLVTQGVPEARISIMSYGAFRPVAQGASADAKARNRRVEIMVRPGAATMGAAN